MNKRELNLEKYGISSKRYKELCAFCEQYPEWISYLNEHGYPVKGITYSDMPKTIGNEDPTGSVAVKCTELRQKCELVEQTAIQTSGDLYQYIIKSVCYETPFNYLQTMDELPCSRAVFYDIRRYFFYLLDQKKKI